MPTHSQARAAQLAQDPSNSFGVGALIAPWLVRPALLFAGVSCGMPATLQRITMPQTRYGSRPMPPRRAGWPALVNRRHDLLYKADRSRAVGCVQIVSESDRVRDPAGARRLLLRARARCRVPMHATIIGQRFVWRCGPKREAAISMTPRQIDRPIASFEAALNASRDHCSFGPKVLTDQPRLVPRRLWMFKC